MTPEKYNRVLTVDRLAWLAVKRGDDLINVLKDRLTVYKEELVSKEITEFKLYEEHLGLLGVPRQYGVEKVPHEQIHDDTVSRVLPDFPAFKGTLFPGQHEAAQTFLSELETQPLGGVLHAKCGTGKTVTCLYLLARLKQKVLVLLHKSDLMAQWRQAIQTFLEPCEIGWVQQDMQNFAAPITLAMYHTVLARHQELEARNFFSEFGTVVVDEVHRLPATTFEQTIRLFPAKHRIGLTATPVRADGMENVFFWHIGPILAQMRGTTVTGEYMQINWRGDYLRHIRNNVARAITLVSKDAARNLMITQWAVEATAKGRHLLILSDRLEQIHGLVSAIRVSQMKSGQTASCSAYVGAMSAAALEQAKKSKVIVGSYGMFELGTDLPSLDTLIIATPRKAVEQVVGRIQRLCEGKKTALVVDVVDTAFGLFYGLGRSRARGYEKLGFKKVGS